MPAELDFTHLNLDARDLEASERFYGALLGLPVQRRETALRIDHPNYLIVLNAGTPNVGGSFHFGFRVPDVPEVDAWIERLRSSGVRVVNEPTHAGAVYVARVADPDGYQIEIYAQT